MPYRMRVYGIAGYEEFGGEPRYLKGYADVENGGIDFEISEDPKDALLFETGAAAIEAWKHVHPDHPVRTRDGKPNRPLSMLTVEIEEIPN